MPSFQLSEFGPRCLYLLFDEPFPIGLFAYEAEDRTFLVDTHLGMDTGIEVRDFLAARRPGLPIEVVYSHYHWDHVWGGEAFAESRIVAHENCPREMRDSWAYALAEYGDCRTGEAPMRLPDAVFSERLSYPSSGVSLAHTPGHTSDSISLFSERDGTAFVADLLEDPLPYVDYHDPARYAAELRKIAAMDLDILVTTHSGRIANGLLGRTVEYLDGLAAGASFATKSEAERQQDAINRRSVLVRKAEKAGREKLGSDFKPERHMRIAKEVFEKSPGEIEDRFAREYGL